MALSRFSPPRPIAVLALVAAIGASGCFGKVLEHRAPGGASSEGTCEASEPACLPDAATPPAPSPTSRVPEPLGQGAPSDYCIVFTVAPLKVGVGGEVAVAAFPRAPGERFRWASADGWFDEPTASSTLYTCDAPGEHLITLTVSDCPGEYTATVRCE